MAKTIHRAGDRFIFLPHVVRGMCSATQKQHLVLAVRSKSMISLHYRQSLSPGRLWGLQSSCVWLDFVRFWRIIKRIIEFMWLWDIFWLKILQKNCTPNWTSLNVLFLKNSLKIPPCIEIMTQSFDFIVISWTSDLINFYLGLSVQKYRKYYLLIKTKNIKRNKGTKKS